MSTKLVDTDSIPGFVTLKTRKLLAITRKARRLTRRPKESFAVSWERELCQGRAVREGR